MTLLFHTSITTAPYPYFKKLIRLIAILDSDYRLPMTVEISKISINSNERNQTFQFNLRDPDPLKPAATFQHLHFSVNSINI